MQAEKLKNYLTYLHSQSKGFAFSSGNSLEKKQQAMAKLQDSYSSIPDHPFSDFTKNKIVFGEGNLNSPLVFLGEGPGRDEDVQGRPFVGRAGQLLTKIIAAMGFKREEVYITNVIKCRLENNRAPQPEEVEYDCNAILFQEFAIVQPKIICLLGSSAMHAILGYDQRISQVRGQFFTLGNCLVLPTYHPAYLLRNPSAKAVVWEDMKAILTKLG